MAVTAEKSTQVTNAQASPVVKNAPYDLGKHRSFYFSFTQGAAAGDATSTQDLCIIPPGKYRIMKKESYIVCSAFGTSRTLDIGHTGYTDYAGVAQAASADCILDGGDVSAAAALNCGAGTNALGTDPTILISAATPLTIQAVVAGGTIPAGATITGYITVIAE